MSRAQTPQVNEEIVLDNRVHRAVLSQKKEIAKDTYEFTFITTDKFSFKPGQYAWLQVLKLKYADPSGDRRALSIVNNPHDPEKLSFIVRGSESGFKKTLLKLKEREEVNIIGPFGFSFVLPDNLDGPLVLLAGGTGIAPFLTLTRNAAEGDIAYPITLLYSEDKSEEAIFADEVNALASRKANLTGNVIFNTPKWEDLSSIANIKKATFYVAGPQGYVDHVNQLLLDNGIAPKKIKFEALYPHNKTTQMIAELLGGKAESEDLKTIREFSAQQVNLLKSIIESSTNHIVVTDTNGIILFANKAAEDMTGYTFAEMRGNTPRLWGGLMSNEFYKKLWDKKQSGESINEEIINRRKNGEIYYVISHISPIRQNNGEIIGFIGTEEDITNLKLQEIEIRDKSQELNTFFDTALDLMGVANINGFFEKVNPQFSKLLGYTTENLTKTPFIDFVHPDDKQATLDEINKLSKGVVTINFVNRYRSKDGTYYWLQWNATPKGQKLYAMARDISQAKENEIKSQIQRERLEQISSRFAFATKSAGIGIWEWDVISDRLTWDDQMYELYGIKKDQFGGAYKAWRAGLHKDDQKLGDDAIQKALTGEKEFDTSFRVVWPDKSIHFIKAYAVVERDENGVPQKMIGVNWDITEEKQIDKAKSEFVSLASHQLKTPVGAVKWDAEMLLSGDYGELQPKQKEVVQEIYNLNLRMSDLVTDFLNMSRIELGTFVIDPQPVKYSDICEDVLTELRERIVDKKHTVSKNYQEDMPETVADAHLLRIIFQNLLSNAIKYTKEGGKIGVNIVADHANVTISVSNNGLPIPEKEKSKIFEKLFRATGAQDMDPDGNGLGLYLLKQIVETAGGRVWFESGKGKDTIFYVSFPLPGMVKKEGTKRLT